MNSVKCANESVAKVIQGFAHTNAMLTIHLRRLFKGYDVFPTKKDGGRGK